MSEKMYHGGIPAPEDLLRRTPGQLRRALGGYFQALDAGKDAAALYRTGFRLLRMAENLDSLEGVFPRLADDDIVGFCRQVMERSEYPAELLGLTLAFRCDKVSHIIAMDAALLERLLLNLLSNAFGATPRGGTVTLEVRLERETVLLSLSDTGAGMEPDAPPRGLGLGLPICRSIAREHGGALVLTAREGGGTAATVSLPNRRAAGHAPERYEAELLGGFNRTLAELSDVLPEQAYVQRFLD